MAGRLAGHRDRRQMSEEPAGREESRDEQQERLKAKAVAGGARHRERLAEQNKLPVRRRLELLLDQGSFVEDGLFANALADDLPADGVVTGVGRIAGRPVCVMANDPTVKAGSWGARTVEKILPIHETAHRPLIPTLYPLHSPRPPIPHQLD